MTTFIFFFLCVFVGLPVLSIGAGWLLAMWRDDIQQDTGPK